MTQDKAKIYFLYARKSSESEDRQMASIESQKRELGGITEDDNLKITATLEESHSAKKRGQRPIFNEMIKRIEKGEANGILLWNVNRLSRNAGDTGIVIDLLDSGDLLEVRTPGQIFRNTPNDKFLLNLFCSQAKLENDNKGVDTKRGLKSKAERGWYPTFTALGYTHNPLKRKGEKEIMKDPERFHLVKKMFDLLLTGHCLPSKIYATAINEWNLRNKFGKNFSISTLYRIFHDPFYYGEFEYPKGSGNWYTGKHEAMITKSEYEKIQIMLGRDDRPRPQKHEFSYSGELRCGECGAMITAEYKIKRQKNGNVHLYTYYHCTKRKDPKCSQRKVVEEKVLEDRIDDILGQIEIPASFKEWAVKKLHEENEKEMEFRNKVISDKRRNYDSSVARLDRLLDMRINGEISENEFTEKKKPLEEEKAKAMELLNDTDAQLDDWIAKIEEALNITEDAQKRFKLGSQEEKNEVFAPLGSNLLLLDKKLHIKDENRLFNIQKASKEVKAIYTRFEPHETPINKEALARAYDQSPMLLAWRDSFRTFEWMKGLADPATIINQTRQLLALV
ncbi:MAG: recombinase family protein [Candidatus Moranbacteria bacterium]|nr:recombinase family protein [Candidatus Moranbacteria bacterium]